MIKKIPFSTHEEWLGIRQQYLGGSDAGAVIGMNPYKSAFSLWAEKTDKLPSFDGNITTKVGAYLEDLVAKMFEEETGKKVRKCNFTMVNDKYPFACANVDRLVVGEDSLLEIKTTNSLPVMKKVVGGEFPDPWLCQMLHYLAVTGLKRAYLAVLVNCREFHVFDIERDEGEINALMSAEEKFWEFVKTNTPPPVDGTESTTETLTTLYPESTEGTVSLTTCDTYLRQYIDLSTQIKLLTRAKDEMANKVKDCLKDQAKGESTNFKVSWVSANKSTFNTKKFAEDNPNLDLSKYYTTTSYRTFKVTSK